MADDYPYVQHSSYENSDVLETTILVEEGVVWHGGDKGEVNISINDDENGDETYATANEDGDSTQYLSVLDVTNEISVNNLGLDDNTIDEPLETLQQEHQENSIEIGGQPVVFRVEGSEDLFAIELAYDQDGNIQRYQYKLRQNENGDYESVPGTIEILPVDSEPEQISPTEVPQHEHVMQTVAQPHSSFKIFVKQEYCNEEILPDLPTTAEDSDELEVNEDDTAMSFEEHTLDGNDTKSEILEGILQENHLQIHHNDESQEPTGDDSPTNSIFEESSEEAHPAEQEDAVHQKVSEASIEVTEQDESATVDYKQYMIASNDIIKEHQSKKTEFSGQHEEEEKRSSMCHNFASDDSHHTTDSLDSEDSEEYTEHNNVEFVGHNLNENDSDLDDYQIVDGVHLTQDAEEDQEDGHEQYIIQDETYCDKQIAVQSQILKLHQQFVTSQNTEYDVKMKKILSNNKLNKNFTFFVLKNNLEKENVNLVNNITAENRLKVNPRSILKPACLIKDKEITEEKLQHLERFNRRYARNKEAIQARLFNNYIAKTTIIHAPVRQERLPRKQTIKPVERTDDNIVVKEVAVTAKGFIEGPDIVGRVAVKPEIVQLTDSDDDYHPQKEQKRKKKQKKHRSKFTEIVISDSENDDVSDESVVHIDLSADSSEEQNEHRNSIDLNSQDVAQGLDKTLQKMTTSGRQRKSPTVASEGHVEANGSSTATDQSALNSTSSDSGSSSRKRRNSQRISKSNNSSTNCDKNVREITEDDPTDGSSSKRQREITEENSNMEQKPAGETYNINRKDEPAVPNTNNETAEGNIRCSTCLKLFPSDETLKIHMKNHNFNDSTTRNLRPSSYRMERNKPPEAIQTSKITNKYECTMCAETFKNKILLTRHTNMHKNGPKSLECHICKKIFPDRSQVISHKRTHVKDQMFKSTTLLKHSPKPASAKPEKLFKSPKKSSLIKCNFCNMCFKNLAARNVHASKHKPFKCTTCGSDFISKLMLVNHVRQSCVKSKSPTKKRLSIATRKSFLKPPASVSRRLSIRKGRISETVNVTSLASASSSESTACSEKSNHSSTAGLECVSCDVKFSTHTALFKHKVVKHGLDTPDKSIMQSTQKSLYKRPGEHGCVPANPKLRAAFAGVKLQTKM